MIFWEKGGENMSTLSVRFPDSVHDAVKSYAMISITEANQNFSKVTRLVDESAIAADEDVLAISKRLLAQNKEAYEVLAK